MPDNEQTLTPSDVKALLTEFVSRERQTYVGMRYVPKFADPIAWDSDTAYEPLTMVTYNDAVYVSKFYVPSDVDISETEYWALWGSLGTGVIDFDALTDELRSAWVRTFDTVSDMQAATDLLDGMTCHTNGFHASGDGGAAYYTVSASGTANGMDVLALQGGLVATLVVASYYNAKQFGIYGDGAHDDTEDIQALLKSIADSGGGTVYFPSGTYNLSNCVYVGDNTRVVGDGASTYFYGTTDASNHMGEFIGVAGSNVTIDNIGGNYLNGNRPFNSATANIGLIGICAWTMDSCIAYNASNDTSDLVLESHEYIIITNIYAPNCTYVLQAETPNPDAHIHHVTYENIQAPNGVVSMLNSGDGVIDYVTIHNVTCAFLRIGTGFVSNITVSDCKCQMLVCTEHDTTIENVTINYDADCDIATWIDAGTFNSFNLLQTANAIVSNVTVTCDTSDMVLIYAENSTTSLFSNVKASGGNGAAHRPMYIGQSLATGLYTRFVNCDFSGVASDGTYKAILSGLYTSCLLPADWDTSSSQIFANNVKRPIVATLATGISNANNTYGLVPMSYATDTEVHIKARLMGTFGNNVELFTVGSAFAPVSDSYMIGVYESSGNAVIGHAIIKVDTSGKAMTVASGSSTSTAALLIDSSYMRGPVCYDPYSS